MKLFRTIAMSNGSFGRFKPNAKEWEWAIPGSCLFTNLDPDDPESAKYVFNAFVGLTTFGYSEWVQVEEISDNDYQRLVNALAHHLFESDYVESLDDGFEAADQELNHAKILANREPGTLMAVDRRMTKNGIEESFKIIPRE